MVNFKEKNDFDLLYSELFMYIVFIWATVYTILGQNLQTFP